MPVVTRSCAKEKRRPFIEQETPVTSTMVRSCRYETRSTAKRKIPQKDQDRENVGPSSKVRKTVFCSDFIYHMFLTVCRRGFCDLFLSFCDACVIFNNYV